MRYAIAAQIPAFFAYDTCAPYTEQAPEEFLGLNGFEWARGHSPRSLAAVLLRRLGLDENERRIFLSYRRQSSEAMALQLRRHLQDCGWHVFLDTFDIEVASADFQVELFRDLDSRSLVLVLESAETRGSPWVNAEIYFAQARGVGIHALVHPEARHLRPRFPGSISTALAAADLIGERSATLLSAQTLGEVADTLQRIHTNAHRLRWEDMMWNVRQTMGDCGLSEVLTTPAGMLVGRRGATTHVVRVTSRRPRLADVFSTARESTGRPWPVKGWVVHRLIEPDPHEIEQIRWLSERHDIQVVPVVEFGRRLRGWDL